MLGFGVFEDFQSILDQKWGKGNYGVVEMKVNWAEEIGLWLNGIAPILLSVGLVCIFVEFKTPGFGIRCCRRTLLLFSLDQNMSLVLLARGINRLFTWCLPGIGGNFLVPGLIIPGIIGFAMMIGAIFWAMVDVWPTPDFTWNMEVFRLPIQELLQQWGSPLSWDFWCRSFFPKRPCGIVWC